MSFLTKYSFFDICHITVIGLFLAGIILMIIGIVSPPIGEISNSILIACGIIFGYAAIMVLMYSIRVKANVKLQFKDVALEVNENEKQKNERMNYLISLVHCVPGRFLIIPLSLTSDWIFTPVFSTKCCRQFCFILFREVFSKIMIFFSTLSSTNFSSRFFAKTSKMIF